MATKQPPNPQLVKKIKFLQNQIKKLKKSESKNREIEKKLRKSSKELGIFINSATDIFMVFDKNFNLISINPAGKKVLGLSEKDIGKHILKLAPYLKGSERYRQYHKVVKTGKPFSEDDIIPGGRYSSLQFDLEAFRVDKGLGIIMRDITERKKAEEALRESEEKYRSLVQNIPDLIYTLDKFGNFTSVNDHTLKLLGYRRNELIGKHFKKVIHPDDEEMTFESFKEAVSTKKSKPDGLTFRLITKDKKVLWVSLDSSMTFDKKGNFIQEQGIARDITERKKAMEALKRAYKEVKESQQQLVQSEKLAVVGQLATGVAHEINNPLSVISGEAEMLLKDKSKDKDTKDASKTLVEQAKRIKSITERLLDFSQERKFTLKLLDINGAVRKSISLLGFQAKVEDIKIVKELASKLPKLLGDQNQLQGLFLNIMLNAVQAMKKGGTLTIKTRRKKVTKSDIWDTDKFRLGMEIAVIEFKDTGQGIKEEMLNRIFDPFFTTKEKSTGLGLSICNRIIKNHNGTITVQSKLGKGSTFIVKLPVKGGGK